MMSRSSFSANPLAHLSHQRRRSDVMKTDSPNKGDATRAFVAANGAPGVFSVKNNLRIEKSK
jgi:hypothetical protein